MATFTPTIAYYLDGTAFSTYGVYVQSTVGITDMPKMKELTKFSSPDLPGEYVDLTAPMLDVKDFTLNCWVKGTNALDLTQKINTFIKALVTPVANVGTHRLHIAIDALSPLVYQVYCPDGMAVNVKFKNNETVATFSVKLREPEPMKRVYRWSSPPTTCSFSIVTSKPVNIYWGDNTATKDIAINSTQTPARTYSGSGNKFIIITGDLDSISYLSTTATLVWDKLL